MCTRSELGWSYFIYICCNSYFQYKYTITDHTTIEIKITASRALILLLSSYSFVWDVVILVALSRMVLIKRPGIQLTNVDDFDINRISTQITDILCSYRQNEIIITDKLLIRNLIKLKIWMKSQHTIRKLVIFYQGINKLYLSMAQISQVTLEITHVENKFTK